MIHILKDPQIVSDIFENEFQSIPPTSPQGEVVASIENGRIDGFVLVEQLVRAGLLWVAPEHRNTPKAHRLTRELAHYVINRVPPNNSLITIDQDERFSSFFQQLGFRREDGVIYRMDF